MIHVFPTATLLHVARQHRIEDYELVPGEPRRTVAEFLRTLLASPNGIDRDCCPPGWLPHLEAWFLTAASENRLASPGLPFAFVEAVNFELTYGCNLACRHCLQEGLRPPGAFVWADANVVAQALEDASWLGLTRTGVNFTGGEIYLPGSPILELIELAARAGINVRSNTNAWWGGRTRFTVGAKRFESDSALVGYLRDIGLKILVLSMDDRYRQYPDLLERVLAVAACCEEAGQPWEIVATDPSSGLVEFAYAKLVTRIQREPRFLIPTLMDTVDIGAAAGPPGSPLDSTRLAGLTTRSPCQGRGFHRPSFLHVNPDGGVRSCLYAPGADVLGNLRDERFPEILNRADGNLVVRLFSKGDIWEFVDAKIAPWKHLYRNVEHPCAASALIARTAGTLARTTERTGRDLTEEEVESIHGRIAAEWNLQPVGRGPGQDLP